MFGIIKEKRFIQFVGISFFRAFAFIFEIVCIRKGLNKIINYFFSVFT